MLVLFLIAISFIPLSSVFAEGTIELNSDQKVIESTDSVVVYGTISGVTNYIPLTLSVIAPDGEVIFSPQVSFDGDGNFKRLIHPPLPSFKVGEYSIIASHDDLEEKATIYFTVSGNSILQNGGDGTPVTVGKITYPGLEISAEALEGSDTITLTGVSITRDTDVTFSIHAPNGNLVSVEQVTPNFKGEFTVDIKTGGPLWTEDGVYTVTANQGLASELEDSIEVEIIEGRVIPEFGAITLLILAISIISLIIVSSKSRIGIMPRL